MKRGNVLVQLAPGVVFAAVVLVPMYFITAPIAGIWPFDPCSTEIREKIPNLLGFKFETTYTDCDAIAKWAYVRVLASHAGQGEKTLLFEYDPNIDEIPEISVVDPTHIVITIPLVSSIKFQRHDWGGVRIEYRIGRVVYEARP